MAVTFKCQKCGAENRLGQLFCRECGTKLDLSQLKPGNTSGGGTLNAVGLISRIVRLVIVLALVVILGMLCWGVPAPGDAPNPQGSQLVQTKMSALRGAIMRNNDVEDVFTEADINGHLNTVLTAGAQSTGFLKRSLKAVSIDIKADASAVWMKTTLGPVPLTYSTDVTFSRAPDGQIIFSAGDVKIGHLNLPGFLRGKTINQFVAVFSGLREEVLLLNRLGEVKTTDGELHVATVKK